jgi:glycosyltransferase involved in cell wall biosynthesis
LITDLAQGGAEIQLVRLITYLKTLGWDISVISILRPEAFVVDLESIGIRVNSLQAKRSKFVDPRTLIRLVKLLNNENPVVLVNFMFHANVLGRVGGRIAGVPIVISSIRNERYGGTFRDLLIRWTDRLDNITVINSYFVAKELTRRSVVDSEKIEVIHNGIPVDDYTNHSDNFNKRILKELGLPSEQFVWLSVGRLERQKDYPTLIRAFALIVEQIGQTSLLIAGQGALKKELIQLVELLNIQHYVHFLGFRQDVPDLICASDAFALSSSWEGLPNAVAEALASSKPVVCTSVGGLPEMVEHGTSGFTVPPHNPEALAVAMMRIMTLPEEDRIQMGKNGRNHIIKHFDTRHISSLWEELLSRQIEISSTGSMRN